MKNLYINRISKLLSLLILFLFLIPTNTKAQSLSEQLGGIKTNFIICDKNGEQKILEQAIFKRASYGGSENSDYGMEALSLEFTIANDKARKKQFGEKLGIYHNISIHDSKNNIIYTSLTSHFSIHTVNTSINSYSLNLTNIPILILDKAHKITIK